jgi:hypothetical protein
MPTLRSGALGRAALLLIALAGVARAQSGRELNLVPIAGGDSDVGIGFGEVSDVAALAPEPPGFRWKVESGVFVTFKLRAGDHLVLPFQDYYVLVTLPNLGPGRRLRLELRPAFTTEATLKYYGIGNASPIPAADLPVETAEYERIHPTLSIEARYRVLDDFYLLGGSDYTENRLSVGADTVLGQQQAAGPPEVRALLGSFGPHGVELLTLEGQYDSRDDETVTRRGQFHTARFRWSPRLGEHLPYQYERLTLTARFYGALFERWLTFRARFVADTLFGDPPFYELARFDETAAIGGGKALRGVPAQRYYGKVKAFGNFEVGRPLWSFTLRRKQMVLGLAAFVDAGRTWTELRRAHPELDGTGLGLKYGVGGGLRLQEGRTFVVRLDVAWSPDASPVGAYFAAGEIF